MSTTSKQLETVFQEVTDHFATVPHITVSPGDGNPPEQYTVSYRIKGVCKEPGGEVYPCNDHVITLTLPFGFPHFPPNCHPETPTFHPDFDSSAICIGDIWESEKSLIKLILHIGHMIAGEIYSVTNAFNEEAAEWYQEHNDRLPFDTLAADQPPPAPPIEPMFDEATDEIDILDDNDFGQPLALEREEEEEEVPATMPPPGGMDLERLRLMAKQKRFHALSQELQSTTSHFNGREDLEEQTRQAMEEATDLYRQGDDLEHQGEQEQALKRYQAVEQLVSDYPQLQDAQKRVKRSLDLLGDWVTGDTEEIHDDGGEEAVESTTEAEERSVSEPPPSAAEPSRDQRTFFEEKKNTGRQWLLYTMVGGGAALLATAAIIYSSLGAGYGKAQKSFGECQELLKNNHFKEAELKCEEAITQVSGVRIVKQRQKKELVKEVQAILDSEEFRQGLAGNILIDGKFVTTSTGEAIKAFKEAKRNGDTFFQEKSWQEALITYEKALTIGKKVSAIDETQMAEIRKQVPKARFNAFVQAGEKSLAISDWQSALKSFKKALDLAKADPNIPVEDLYQIELLFNQASFNSLRKEGDAFFAKGDWMAALDRYHQALDIGAKLNLQESGSLSELQENIARTKIYMRVAKGKEAFAASRWDEAINQYEKAIILLEENSKVLSQINTDDSREKLSRIMLHASIIRDKQDAAKFLKSREYGPALKKLQAIAETIKGNPAGRLPEFQATLKEVASQIKDAQRQLLISDKTKYLMDNYQQLFLKHYPAAAHSVLSSPTVEYVKMINGKLMFRMQCTEQSGGRPLRLQMDYLYSPSTGQWQFYSEEEQ